MSRANCKILRPARSRRREGRRPPRDGSASWWVLVVLLAGLLGPQVGVQPAAAEDRLNPKAQSEIEALREQITTLLAGLPEDERAAAREALLAALDEAAAAASAIAASSATTEVANDSVSPVDASSAEASSDLPAATATPPVPLTASAGTEVASATTTTPPPPAAPPVVERRRVRPPRCTTLLPFDENDDGKINAQDRWWRYLYVWIDRNGDRQVEEREVHSAYEKGVREIAADLDSFYRRKGSLGEIRVEEQLLFDLDGNGFGTGRRDSDGALAVDATALRRGAGPSLQTANGTPVEGVQPFERGWRLVFDDGRSFELTCRRR